MQHQKFVIAFDNHGDMADPEAVAAFKQFVADWKPDIRIHGGDCFDLRALRGGASVAERMEGMRTDVNAGVDFLRWFRPQVFLAGNHEKRIYKAIEQHPDGNMREHCINLMGDIMDALGDCDVKPWGKRRTYQLANYRVLHGYHSGVYSARQVAQAYGNAIMGHVHTPGYYELPHIDPTTGYTSGCLCLLDMDYNDGQANTLRQRHGWVHGIIRNGMASPYAVAREPDGEWCVPTEWSDLGGSHES